MKETLSKFLFDDHEGFACVCVGLEVEEEESQAVSSSDLYHNGACQLVYLMDRGQACGISRCLTKAGQHHLMIFLQFLLMKYLILFNVERNSMALILNYTVTISKVLL